MSYERQFQKLGFRVTIPGETDDEDVYLARVEPLRKFLQQHVERYVFQLERGDELNRLHFQGRLQYPRNGRKTTIATAKLFTKNGFSANIQIESKEGEKAHTFYCQKEETRVAGPWTNPPPFQYVPKRFREIALLPWQEQALGIMRKLTERQVMVIWDPKGSRGKSHLVDYLDSNNKGFQVAPSLGSTKEIIQTVNNEYVDRMQYDPTVQTERQLMFVDLTRSADQSITGKMWSIWLSAMEDILKGKLFEARYKYSKIWVEPPYMAIMTNHLPPLGNLTHDRWQIYTFDENDMLVKNDADGLRAMQQMQKLKREKAEKYDLVTLLKKLIKD